MVDPISMLCRKRFVLNKTARLVYVQRAEKLKKMSVCVELQGQINTNIKTLAQGIDHEIEIVFCDFYTAGF